MVGQTGYDEQMDKLNEGEKLISEWESRTEALLLGRKTYEIWAGAWGVWDENAAGLMGELTRRYNRVPKYVASNTLTELHWKNSQLLGPDVPTAKTGLPPTAPSRPVLYGVFSRRTTEPSLRFSSTTSAARLSSSGKQCSYRREPTVRNWQ